MPTLKLEMNKNKVVDIISLKTGIDKNIITADSTWQDLGIDESMFLKLLFDFEEIYNTEIPSDDADKMNTIQDLVDYIARHLGHKPDMPVSVVASVVGYGGTLQVAQVMPEIKKNIIFIILRRHEIDNKKINVIMSSTFNDLKLNKEDVLATIQRMYGIKISADEAAKINKIQDIADYMYTVITAD